MKNPQVTATTSPQFEFSNLQIGDNDLVGNMFNGHNLHKELRQKKVDSSHLVFNKESNDPTTYWIASQRVNRDLNAYNLRKIQKEYSLNGICGVTQFDILYNKLFLDTDIVHLHLIHNLNFDLQQLPLISKLKPTIWTLHDPWALSGHCISHYDCERWKTGCGDCPMLDIPFEIDEDNSALNHYLKKEAIQNSAITFVVASKWMEDKVHNSPTFKDKEVVRIPFGINQNVFKPLDKDQIKKELDIDPKYFVLIFRSDNTYTKGIRFIEYALNNLNTDKEIFLLVLGEDLPDSLSHFPHKQFSWIKDENLMAKILNASDLFLMPSLSEAFGMMAIEAMSCGIIPVVIDGTALPDVVNAPDCGVSSKRDEKDYKNLVELYINNNGQRDKHSLSCLEYARKEYNRDLYVNRIKDLYQQKLKSFKIGADEQYLLSQLKKHMQVNPSLKAVAQTPIYNALGKRAKVKFHLRKILRILNKTRYTKWLADIILIPLVFIRKLYNYIFELWRKPTSR